MAGVDGVTGLSRQNRYDDSDIENMKGKEALTTNAAINRIANHAGLGDTHTIHGADKTEAEVRAEHYDRMQEMWVKQLVELIPGVGEPVVEAYEIEQDLKKNGLESALKSRSVEAVAVAIKGALEHASDHAIEHVGARALRAAGGLVEVGKLLDLAKTMIESVAADGDAGAARAEARVKSALHTAIAGSLNGLPKGFIGAMRDHYAADAPPALVAHLSQALGRGDNALMGIIQLHCDQGIGAARAMYTAGQTPADCLKTRPDIVKRLADDPGFRAGFEGAIYAHEHGQYDAVMKALDARDVRYENHHVAFRG